MQQWTCYPLTMSVPWCFHARWTPRHKIGLWFSKSAFPWLWWCAHVSGRYYFCFSDVICGSNRLELMSLWVGFITLKPSFPVGLRHTRFSSSHWKFSTWLINVRVFEVIDKSWTFGEVYQAASEIKWPYKWCAYWYLLRDQSLKLMKLYVYF